MEFKLVVVNWEILYALFDAILVIAAVEHLEVVISDSDDADYFDIGTGNKAMCAFGKRVDYFCASARGFIDDLVALLYDYLSAFRLMCGKYRDCDQQDCQYELFHCYLMLMVVGTTEI